jgi:hypothetical protein
MRKAYILFFGLALYMTSCTFDDQVDPNAPSLNSVLNNATLQELNLLVTGTEAAMRNGFGSFVTSSGSIAREFYKFDADPRNTEDLLGKNGAQLDNNTFYLTSPYNSRYRVIKNCNILLEAVENTEQVSAAEKDGYRGFANTIKSQMLLQVLSMLDDNGIRIDVADAENIGPFVNKGQAYSDILTLLDLGFSQLSGASFAFQLSSGFSGFNTPSSFGQYNRAIAAKTALYSENYTETTKVISTSFFDLNGDLSAGPKHVFSNSSGDIQNPLFKAAGQSGDQLVVHDDFINNAIAGDSRLSKFRARVATPSQDDLNGTHETALYVSSTSPIDIIRNEELILIYAEASMQNGDLADAVTAINVIRNAAGIGDYAGAVEKDALIDEILFQRSYSLWGEGHRMFDLRRYGRLNDQFLPIDRPGDIIHVRFPIPLTEGQ